MTVRRRRHTGSRASGIRLSRPVCTVSLAFRRERLLGEPSIHMCSSRLPFGLRGSNSHFQSQNLAFCRLNEARSSGRSGEIRTLTSRSKNPVRCRYATDPERGRGYAFELGQHGWEWMGPKRREPAEVLLGRAPKTLWLFVGQPDLRVGNPPGFLSGGGGGRRRDGILGASAALTLDRPHPAQAQGSAPGG